MGKFDFVGTTSRVLSNEKYPGCPFQPDSFLLSFDFNCSKTRTGNSMPTCRSNPDEFEKTIHINEVNPKSATVVEMRALEAHMGVKKLGGFTSLPMEAGAMGLNDRTDFMDMFQKQIGDMKLLLQKKTAAYYQYSMQAYWDFMNKK